jgi:hypothetical protein
MRHSDRRTPGIRVAASINVFLTGKNEEGLVLGSGIGEVDGRVCG